MNCSKIKIMIYLTMVVMLLFTPYLLDVSPGGKSYAMGFLGKKAGNSNFSGGGYVKSDPVPQPEKSDPSQPPINPVPEPATILLVGAGAAGLAAYKKKFRKK